MSIVKLDYFCHGCRATHNIPQTKCKRRRERANWRSRSRDATCVYVFEQSLWMNDPDRRVIRHISLDQNGKPQHFMGEFRLPWEFSSLGFEMWEDNFMFYDTGEDGKAVYFSTYYRMSPLSVLQAWLPKDLCNLIIQYLGDPEVRKWSTGYWSWNFLRFEHWVWSFQQQNLLVLRNLLDEDNVSVSLIFPIATGLIATGFGKRTLICRIFAPEQFLYTESLVERWLLQCGRTTISVTHLVYQKNVWSVLQEKKLDPFCGFLPSRILAVRCDQQHHIWLLNRMDESLAIYLNIYSLNVSQCALISIHQEFVMKMEDQTLKYTDFDIYEQEPNVYRVFFILKNHNLLTQSQMFWVRLPST